MQKKELYNRLIDEYKQLPHSSYKATWTEEVESHCFGYAYNSDLSETKALFKENGWKSNPSTDAEFYKLQCKGKTLNTYLTVLYDIAKDKISIALFQVGYAYSVRKLRYYPIKENLPAFCWSKHMYMFAKIQGKLVPRIQMGTIVLGGFPQYGTKATEILMNTKIAGSGLGISYRHYMNAKSEYEPLERYAGVKIPAVLKKFVYLHELIDLYKSIKDYNEINKICQFIAANPDIVKEYMFGTGDEQKISLYNLISHMLFGNGTYNWLIADSIGDCKSLRERALSLKVTSLKRWQEEHQRRSRLRMLKGVANIKTADVYRNALEGLEYKYELIDDKERLIQESLEMSHCVATYANKINSGHCGIFSIMYEGNRYTLEVGKVDKYLCSIQLKGKFNAIAPEQLQYKVNNVLLKDLLQTV
jgi:hypothetical protein